MASITQLVNYFKADSKEFESLIHDFIINCNDVPFESQEIDTLQNVIITSINSRLNQVNTRYNGLLILDRVLDRCSKDTFSKYGLLWITKAIQVLENVRSNTRDLTLACKILGRLIEHCKEIPDLHKQISMHIVKQLINTLSALQTDAKCGAVYYLIAVLLYHYPEVCERFQVSIKKMILLQIDSAQENLINASARCYILLSRAMERSFKPLPEKSIYTAWIYDEALLCNTLHAIMDTLFSELIELESVDIWDQLELPAISKNNMIQYYNRHKQRFSNLCIYLSSMLRGYQEKNFALPHDILKVLCRGLAITPLNLKNTTFKEQMLYIILPKLHISLLSVLDALINGFAQELIPFGAKILLLFQQTLQWTSTVLDNQTTITSTKPFKSVRIRTYQCLSSWLMNTSSSSGIETIINETSIYILRDIVPERDRILLTVQQKTQHLSKPAMKRFKASQYENSSILNNEVASAKSESLDTDLCKEALVTLQNILSSGNVLLTQTFYKNVQNSVIPLLRNLYLDSAESNFYKIHNECRLELFKTLKALQMNPHVTLAFPTQYCLEISHMANYDVDLNIAQEAKHAIAELEKIIHPVAPTLRLPQQQRCDDESVDEDQVREIVDSSKSDKRNRIDDEFSSDAIISSVLKRSRINVSESTETVEIENQIERSTESITETSNGIMSADKPQANDAGGKIHNIVRTSKQRESTDVPRELEKTDCNEEERRDVDEIMDISIESTAKYKLIKHTKPNVLEEREQDEQLGDSALRTDEVDETMQRSANVITEEGEILQNNIAEEQKEANASIADYQTLFNNKV